LSEPETILGHRNSESFKGVNDLTFDDEGNCYFTDQGQTGLHDPSGRVYRLRANGILDLVMGGIPSPNGVALGHDAESDLHRGDPRERRVAWPVARRRIGDEGRGFPHILRHQRARTAWPST
jgi:sugar lactone lactonase YvrE